jgi:hypothetical protein
MVVVEVGEAIASGFPGKGKSVLPFPLGAVGNPLVGFPTKVRCGGGVPPRADLMAVVPEPFPRGERLRPSKQSDMSSRLLKRTV